MENKEEGFELKNNWTKSVETFDQLEVKKGLLRGIFGNYYILVFLNLVGIIFFKRESNFFFYVLISPLFFIFKMKKNR